MCIYALNIFNFVNFSLIALFFCGQKQPANVQSANTELCKIKYPFIYVFPVSMVSPGCHSLPPTPGNDIEIIDNEFKE